MTGAAAMLGIDTCPCSGAETGIEPRTCAACAMLGIEPRACGARGELRRRAATRPRPSSRRPVIMAIIIIVLPLLLAAWLS